MMMIMMIMIMIMIIVIVMMIGNLTTMVVFPELTMNQHIFDIVIPITNMSKKIQIQMCLKKIQIQICVK